MQREPSPATSDLMALVCLIGGAVRGAGALGLLVPLLVIGGFCPPLKLALRIWLAAEECFATTEFGSALFAEADGVGGEDEVRAGWVDRDGPVEVWRHVTRFGIALLIPMQRALRAGWPRVAVLRASVRPSWFRSGLLAAVSSAPFFSVAVWACGRMAT